MDRPDAQGFLSINEQTFPHTATGSSEADNCNVAKWEQGKVESCTSAGTALTSPAAKAATWILGDLYLPAC